MLSFDTNILVYAADSEAAGKHTLALNLLAIGSQLDAVLTEQALIEYLNVATRKANRTLEDAADLVQSWAAVFPVLVPGETIVEDTLRLLFRHKLSVWDARLIAVCATGGCAILLSEDLQDNAVYDGVRVINPFNADSADRLAGLLTQ